MGSPRAPTGLLALVHLTLAASAVGAAQAPSDPYGAGPTWVHAATPSQPWIPRSVAFAADGELVWAGRSHTHPGALLLGAQLELGGAWVGGADAAAETELPVSVAVEGANLLSAVRRGPAAGASVVVEARRAGVGEPPLSWRTDLGWTGAGAPILRAAGGRLFVAESSASPATLRVTALDAAHGGVLWSRELTAGTLRGVEVSESGGSLWLLAGDRCLLLEASSGTTLVDRTHRPAPRSLGLSADGARVALGGSGRVELWSDDPQQALPLVVVDAAPQMQAVALALDDHGSRLAVGWWDQNDARTIALELWSDLDLLPWLDQRLDLAPTASGPQNFVSAVDRAGSRVAFGLWGDDGGSSPELVVLEWGGAAPLLAQDLAGSVDAVALDPRGERVAVGRRAGHANQFVTAGAVELLGTGERDLTLSSTPRGGHQVWIEHAAEGAAAAWILLGRPAGPVALPGLDGPLALDLAGPLVALATTPVGPGRFGLPVVVPIGAIGLEIGLQGLSIGETTQAAAGGTWSSLRIL